jgi:hypothetical protein
MRTLEPVQLIIFGGMMVTLHSLLTHCLADTTTTGDSNIVGRPQTRHMEGSSQKWESTPQVNPFLLNHVVCFPAPPEPSEIDLWNYSKYTVEYKVLLH